MISLRGDPSMPCNSPYCTFEGSYHCSFLNVCEVVLYYRGVVPHLNPHKKYRTLVGSYHYYSFPRKQNIPYSTFTRSLFIQLIPKYIPHLLYFQEDISLIIPKKIYRTVFSRVPVAPQLFPIKYTVHFGFTTAHK